MKLALIADLHLGSKDIDDGRWKERALREVVVPALRENHVTHIIFPGDTLDFQGASTTSAEKPELLRCAVQELKPWSAQSFLLLGNHDDPQTCTFFQHMGGPRIVRDDWVELGNETGAYLMAPRQEKSRARSAVDQIEDSRFKSRILVLHEDLDVFHDDGFLSAARAKFQLIVNGHNHVFRPVRDGVYLLPACLPWKPQRGSQCDLIVNYAPDGTLAVKTDQLPWGFVVVEDDLQPQFVSVASGVRLVICNIEIVAAETEQAIRQTLDFLLNRGQTQSMAVRAYVAPRLDSDLEVALRDSYAGRFFDLRFASWQGHGALAKKVRERLPTEQSALEHVRMQHGDRGRALVEQLSQFFHLRTPRNRKEDILDIVKNFVPESSDHA